MENNILLTAKHVLFLENEYWNNQVMVNHLHNRLVSVGIKCTVIDNASNRKDEIIAVLPTIDAVCFESTFLYEDEVKGVGDLLKRCPKPLLVFGGVIGDSIKTLAGYLERLWEVKELAEMSHHRVFELKYSRYTLEDGGEWYTEIDMLQYKQEWERLEHECITKNKNMPKTGNKVLIKEIQSNGGAFANLKKGDIVDELDCRTIDNEPHKGIWVMGVEEPVKLLNADRYEEWEYHEPSYLALTKEFFARGNRANAGETELYGNLFDLMSEWIRKCSSSTLQTNDTELWEWCDTICQSVGVERRGNRNYFDKRIKEYRERFHFFREDA
jgi:hypothetical protein